MVKYKAYFVFMATFLFDCTDTPFNQREKNLLAFSKEQNLRPDVGYQENRWVKIAFFVFSRNPLINYGMGNPHTRKNNPAQEPQSE